MHNDKKHTISEKELDNLLNKAFLDLDFTNHKNKEIMETVSTQYLSSNTTLSSQLKNIATNKLFLSGLAITIITTIAILIYSKQNITTPVAITKSINKTLISENFKPETPLTEKAIVEISLKKKNDSVILLESVKEELVDNTNMVESNENKIISEQKNTSNQSNYNPLIKKVNEDSSYVFPTLTEDEIKANHKQKKRMINALVSMQKSKYVKIPMGSFEHEKKQVSVYSYYMQYAEVTNLEYRTFIFDLLINNRKDEFLKAKPNQKEWMHYFNDAQFYKSYQDNYFSHPAYNEYPVVNITKEGAELFCNWLTTETNNYLQSKNKPLINDLRLPTITEWIYAAKGNRNGEYPWGTNKIQNDKNCFLANFNTSLNREDLNMNCPYIKYHNAETVVGIMLDGSSTTAPVYSFNPNDYGLFCMSGNVYEMTYNQDDNYKATKEIILKGGSWNSNYNECKLKHKEEFKNSDKGNPTVGFRPIMSINPKN